MLQRRRHVQLDFNRNWIDDKGGFGDHKYEHGDVMRACTFNNHDGMPFSAPDRGSDIYSQETVLSPTVQDGGSFSASWCAVLNKP